MSRNKLLKLLLAAVLTAGCSAKKPASAASETPASEHTPSSESGTAVTPEPEVTYPQIESGISGLSKYGNIVLTVSPQSMKDLGYEPADIITVKIGDHEMDMPVGTAYTDVDSGEPVCCYKTSSTNEEVVVLALNAGNLAAAMGVAEITRIDEDPGYTYEWAEGLDDNVTVYLNMKEKQGFAEEYAMHQLGAVRTNKREDYAHLSDEEFANFRAVNTTGMGKDTLYRSSSPINPAYNRSEIADHAMMDALIKTAVNMADSEGQMKAYSDYGLTYYSSCNIIPLNMSMDIHSEEYKEELIEGFRFIASNEGPYLVHCNEGKDRTGFAIAILECLMGADLNEIVEDYMLTFYNYYGIEPGTEQYTNVAESNILSSLKDVFQAESLDGLDLAKCAEEYLTANGMSAEEITSLKEKLSQDYGGLN